MCEPEDVLPPLGQSDRLHRVLRKKALAAGSRHLGHKDKIMEEVASLGYTREDLDKCVVDYSAFWNMYEEDGMVSFTCMPENPPASWTKLDPPLFWQMDPNDPRLTGKPAEQPVAAA